ncbi:hypothetical protein [Streptomyces sp. NPDC050504]|uniref:hypothetical protein n=1 Tax=Streptomyces sp. NPDC050504 TaxID=3365618 RepID=UPI0037959573
MSRHDPNHRLAALLKEADWSAADLARAVNSLGAAQGLDLHYRRTAVAHWLAGSHPQGAVPHLAAQALSQRIRRLVPVEDTGLTPAVREQLLPRPTPFQEADPVLRLNTLARDDADPARRGFLARTAYTLTAVALPGLPARIPAQWAGTEQRTGAEQRVHSADIQVLKDMTQTFATLCDRYGGAHARTALAAYLADDATSIASAPAPPVLHRQILVQCAQLTHLLANMTTDAGHQGLAQQYYRAALSLALNADDHTSYAVTLRAMSSQALRLGHAHHAHGLARAAADAAGPDATPATRAFLLAQRALTSAADGDRRGALADLAAAEQEHGRATSPPGPFSAYPQAGLEYQHAQTLYALGDRRGGLAALRDAARHRPSSRRRLYVLTQASLADRLLDAGHLEEACVHLHSLLDHSSQLRSARADKALAHLSHRLRSFPRQRQAAEALERTRELWAARPCLA